MRQIIQYFLLANVLLLALAVWQNSVLPAPTGLDPTLLIEPQQTKIDEPAFTTIKNDIAYTVSPLYDYDLTGLVVSMHAADTWWDSAHKDWHDALNVMDLCVVWGNNIRNGSYQGIAFSSGQFTCNFSTHSDSAYAAFDQTAISNNHLLTDNPALAKAISKVHIGDVIHFHGRLSEYAHNHGFAFKRGTSIVRTDSGNGACETVFIDEFHIISSSKLGWRTLVWLSSIMLILGVIAWFLKPVRGGD